MRVYHVKQQQNNDAKNLKSLPFKGFQEVTASIQGNTLLNRGLLNTLGFAVPYAINANNKTERNERLVRSVWISFVAYFSPLFLLPFLNKKAMQHTNLAKNGKDKTMKLLLVSKEYLNENAPKMIQGIKEKGKALGLEKEFGEVLKTYIGKEEQLREKLINAHKNILIWDFVITNCATVATAWIGNTFTKLRTGRSGFSGEFKMADKEYTSKLTEKHEKNKNKKMALSFIMASIPAIIFPKYLAKSMKNNKQSLSRLGKWFKQNAGKFDYKDAMFMSMTTYTLMWFTGDYPSYFLACRDKHELKYAFYTYTTAGLFFFFGDKFLNSFIGKKIDKHLKTQMMDYKNHDNKNFMEKILTPMKDLKEIDKIQGDVGKLTQKCAHNMYWLNMALTALILGVGLPQILNKILRKDVKNDIKWQNEPQSAISLPKTENKIFKDFIK